MLGLQKINFEIENVEHVKYEDDNLVISTNKQIIKIICGCLNYHVTIKQENRRWDWVKKLVTRVEEQPIVLEIYEGCVSVIFQY